MAASRQSSPIGHPPAPVEQAVGDVVEHAEAVEQEELLEDEAEAPGPQARQLLVGHGRGVLSGDADHAAGGSFEGAHHVQKGALARPGRADDGDQLALVDPQVDAGQGHDRRVGGVLLDHVDQLEDRRRRGGLAEPGPGPSGSRRRHLDPGAGGDAGPADLDQGVVVEAGGDPDEMAGAAGHHVHAEPTAREGQEGVHRRGEDVVWPVAS